MMQCVRKYGVVGIALWARSSKRGEFRCFIGTVQSAVLHWKVYTWAATLCGVGSTRIQEEEVMVTRVSRVSKIRVGIRDSVRIRVSLVLVIGWG